MPEPFGKPPPQALRADAEGSRHLMHRTDLGPLDSLIECLATACQEKAALFVATGGAHRAQLAVALGEAAAEGARRHAEGALDLGDGAAGTFGHHPIQGTAQPGVALVTGLARRGGEGARWKLRSSRQGAPPRGGVEVQELVLGAGGNGDRDGAEADAGVEERAQARLRLHGAPACERRRVNAQVAGEGGQGEARPRRRLAQQRREAVGGGVGLSPRPDGAHPAQCLGRPPLPEGVTPAVALGEVVALQARVATVQEVATAPAVARRGSLGDEPRRPAAGGAGVGEPHAVLGTPDHRCQALQERLVLRQQLACAAYCV